MRGVWQQIEREIDGEKKSCQYYPKNYTEQIQSIANDMKSVGVRHNDMRKQKDTDIVIDSNGIVHLVDFGWASIHNSLAMTCQVNARHFQARDTRPTNPVIDAGFANVEETRHTNPCPHRTFRKFMQRNGQGSQQEYPSIFVNKKKVFVSGYQHFQRVVNWSNMFGNVPLSTDRRPLSQD